ncbi:hypothetical protein ACH4Q7_22350 [Streptomyces roseolus]|uniref:hypothetical protein n=1 Tax=Streptomyces roseolus TaxID=67358 RepID=UPI0037BC4124
MTTVRTRRRSTKADDTTAQATPEEVNGELQHYKVEEAAALIGMSRRWLAGRAAAREVPCTYISGQLRFTPAHIRAISKAGEVIPAQYRPAS